MRFTVRAESGESFAAWITQARGRGGVLDGSTFAELARPTRAADELTYGLVAEDPFASVAGGHVATRWSIKEAL